MSRRCQKVRTENVIALGVIGFCVFGIIALLAATVGRVLLAALHTITSVF